MRANYIISSTGKNDEGVKQALAWLTKTARSSTGQGLIAVNGFQVARNVFGDAAGKQFQNGPVVLGGRNYTHDVRQSTALGF